MRFFNRNTNSCSTLCGACVQPICLCVDNFMVVCLCSGNLEIRCRPDNDCLMINAHTNICEQLSTFDVMYVAHMHAPSCAHDE